MATVVTEHDTVLTELDADRVIRDAGFDVVSFQIGPPPKLAAVLFYLDRFEPDERARVERALREDLEDADKIAIDSLGRATVVMSGRPAAAQAAVIASLKKRGVAAQELETRTWPKLDATYTVTVSGMNGLIETRTVANALANVSKVVAVHVYQDTGTAMLWLKEPCNMLEANVRSALELAGFSLSSFELES